MECFDLPWHWTEQYIWTYQYWNQVGALIDSVWFPSGFETHLSSEYFLCKMQTLSGIRKTAFCAE